MNLPAAPPTVIVKALDHESVALVLPWKKDCGVLYRLTILLMLFTLTLLLLEVGQLFLLVLAVMLPVLYQLLVVEFNCTTFLVTPNGIQISTGPLPVLTNDRIFRATQLARLDVTTTRHLNRNFIPYRLSKLTASGGGTLVSDWSSRASLDYVRSVIETVVKVPIPESEQVVRPWHQTPEAS